MKNKDKLLRELKEVFDYYLKNLRYYPSEVEVRQAYKDIKEIIKNSTGSVSK